MFLYIRETPNSDESLKLSKTLRNCDCIIGDLNLNPKIPEQNEKLLTICGETKHTALHEITTNYSSQLDHVIIENDLENCSYATAYHNFASDHKSIVFRMTSIENNFTSSFLQQVNFDEDWHLKRKVMPNDDNVSADVIHCC